MTDSTRLAICQRIAGVRVEVAGPRGKSHFAKQLGISPSTYDYYESSRVPPADVLVRIADIAGVDLRWLLTGEASASHPVPSGHPVLQRAAALLATHPDSAKPLAAFLDILAASLQFPAKDRPPEVARLEPTGRAEPWVGPRPAAVGVAGAGPGVWPSENGRESWIPILGRSAAGVPQFWSGDGEESGAATLAELARRHAGRRPARAEQASASGPARLSDVPVQLVTLEGPDDSDVAEYMVSPEVRARFCDAFAVRIDGASMSPEIRHGDLVVLSPRAPAADGRPAVVQLRRQIGVTCKLFRRQGDSVHLVPVNEQFGPQEFPAGEVVWALRVLATIRPAGALAV